MDGRLKGGLQLNKQYMYKIWKAMLFRCYSSKCSIYHNYGGRGIKVCQRWHIYENFKKDMGERPTKKYSIDRIDNDGDYTPENCRWATYKQQANNTRKSTKKIIDINGEKYTVKEFAVKINRCISTINNWLRQNKDIKEMYRRYCKDGIL